MIRPEDYTYHLPEERIAQYPLPERDSSKLLVYNKGEIQHAVFKDLADFLPSNAILFFNDTRVIHARLLFARPTGAQIEVFLLSPEAPHREMHRMMNTTASCVWRCAIGNLKRWKSNPLIVKTKNLELQALLVNRETGTVELRWTPTQFTLAEVLHQLGKTPLPPYIKRNARKLDESRYQTVYSRHEGAVAAPTAGLHFTNRVFDSLAQKGIEHDFLTLHVSAGTFQPIKTADALQHVMHEEQIVVSRRNLETLLRPGKLIVAVGTTSLRTLESLYWYGFKLLRQPQADFRITQYEPQQAAPAMPAPAEALHALLSKMDREKTDSLTGHTSLYIYPGYRFALCHGLITNFHLPGSTLMLLVAAFTGNDWKKIYQEALANNYRFLSYGDSSLLIP
ncbi:MAG: S-adenosylmethionine:tRNA ribosyltransferase-isomerase [Cyclobacteriaceae bacterium]|nr:MAG: S-adenosylmethionine:tRNA ribosyltransferase-isomerase [Cyclobacteriaceae bacterium]